MASKSRVEKLENRIKPGVDEKVFFSYDYSNEAEYRKAIKDYKKVNPESKIKIFTFIGSKENDAGEVTHRTMFDKVKDE